MPKNPHHPFAGPYKKPEPKFPKVTDSMLERCRERNVHVWNLATKPEQGVCIACGISEADAATRGRPQWRLQHA